MWGNSNDAEHVKNALDALSADEHAKMVTYLTNGGSQAPEDAEVNERPCFAMVQAYLLLI